LLTGRHLSLVDFYFNLNGGAITLGLFESQHVTAPIEMMGGQDEELRLQTHRNGTPTLPPTGSEITYAIKPPAKFEGTYLAEALPEAWSPPRDAAGYLINYGAGYVVGDTALIVDSGAGDVVAGDQLTIGANTYLVATALDTVTHIVVIAEPGLIATVADNAVITITSRLGFFTAIVTLDTSAIRTALLRDGDATNDLPAIEAANTQFQYWPPGADRPKKSLRFTTKLDNWVIDDEETSPTPTPRQKFVFNFPTVTGYIGGTSTDFDNVPTLTRSVPQLASIVVSGVTHLYRLVSGTDAESSPTIIRPDDYATTTNEKVWKLVDPVGTFVAQGASWTHTAGSPGAGLFTTNTAFINTTGSIDLSIEPLGDGVDWARMPLGTHILFTDTTLGGSARYEITAMTGGASANPVLTVTLVNDGTFSGFWAGAYVVSFIPGINNDSGWTGNAGAGDKTQAIANYSGTGLDATMISDLNTLSAGAGTALAQDEDRLKELVKKVQAIETALVAGVRPNA
jgi:hypothetical protein